MTPERRIREHGSPSPLSRVIRLLVLILAIASLVPAHAPPALAANISRATVNEFGPNLAPVGDPQQLWSHASGRMVAIDVNPFKPSEAIAASPTGGLFKTVDMGTHWFHINGLRPHVMSDVRYSPVVPGVVIATVAFDSKQIPNEAGIWRSTDGGTTWIKPSKAEPFGVPCSGRPGAYGISFMPPTHRVFIGTDCGLARSSNDGGTWTHVTPGAGITTQTGVFSVAAHHGNVVDVCGANGRQRLVLGSGWQTHPPTTLANCTPVDVHAIAASPIDRNVVWSYSGGALFESDDGGSSWIRNGVPAASNRPPFVHAHASASSDLFVDVYFGNGVDSYVQTCRGPTSTSPLNCRRRASAWTRINPAGTDETDIAYASAGAHVCPLYETSDRGVGRFTDCGLNWTLVGGAIDGLNGLQIYEVAGQTSDHTDLYFGTQDNSIGASPDGGLTWPGNRVCCEGLYIQTPPSAPGHAGQIVTMGACGPPCPTTVRTAHFDSTGLLPPPSAPAGFSTGDLTNPPYTVPFVVTSGVWVQFAANASSATSRLYVTTDGGVGWRLVTTIGALGSRPYVSGPPSDPSVYVYADPKPGGSAFRLLEIPNIRMGPFPVAPRVVPMAGKSAPTLPLGTNCQFDNRPCTPQFAVSPSDRREIAVVDSAGILWTTRDAGATWIEAVQLQDLITEDGLYTAMSPSCGACVTTGDGPQVQAIAVSGARTFLGTADRGVIASTDHGQTWAVVPTSERINNVTSFFPDDLKDRLIVSSYGRGLWAVQFPTVDAGITAQADQTTLHVGDLVHLTFNVTNAPSVPGTVQAPAVTEVVPRGFSVAAMPAECRSNQFINAPQRILCLLGDLAPGAGRTLTLTLRMDARTGPSVLNVASVGHPLGEDHHTGSDAALTLFTTP